MTAVPDAEAGTDTSIDVAESDESIKDDSPTPAVGSAPPPDGSGRKRLSTVIRWVVSIGAAFVIYAVFLLARGADPVEGLRAMWDSAFGDATGIGETLLRTSPLLLGALAVVVPAKAGLFNIG